MQVLVRQTDGSLREETMVDIEGIIEMVRNAPAANTKAVREIATWFRSEGFATEDQYKQLMQEADRLDGLYLS